MKTYLANILFFIVGLFFISISMVMLKKKAFKDMSDCKNKIEYYEKKVLRWTSISFLMAGIIIISTAVLGAYFSFINSAVSFGITVCLLAIAIGIAFNKYDI